MIDHESNRARLSANVTEVSKSSLIRTIVNRHKDSRHQSTFLVLSAISRGTLIDDERLLRENIDGITIVCAKIAVLTR